MTLPFGIFVKPSALAGDRLQLARTIEHELVHVRQWQTHGIWRFLRRYLGEYLRGRRKGLGHDEAYRAISFEVEARLIAGA